MTPAKTVAASLTWLGAVVLCLVAGVFAWNGISLGPSGIGCFAVTALALATAFALLARPVRRQWPVTAGLAVLTILAVPSAYSYRAWRQYTDVLADVSLRETAGNIEIRGTRYGGALRIDASEVQTFAPVRMLTPAEFGEGRYLGGNADRPKPYLTLYGTPSRPGRIVVAITAGAIDTALLHVRGDAFSDHRQDAVNLYLTGGRVALHGRRLNLSAPICDMEIEPWDEDPLPGDDFALVYVGEDLVQGCGRPEGAAAIAAVSQRTNEAFAALAGEATLTLDLYARDGTHLVSATFATDNLKAAFARADLLSDRVRRRDFGVPYTPWFAFTQRFTVK